MLDSSNERQCKFKNTLKNGDRLKIIYPQDYFYELAKIVYKFITGEK